MNPLTVFRRASIYAFVIALPWPLSAQTAQRSAIVGRVIDQTGAVLPGAAVLLSGPSVLGGERWAHTDPEGRFRFGELLPGSYVVSASASGLQRQTYRGIDLPVETTRTLVFTLPLERHIQQVELSAEPPLLDVTSTASPTFFGRELLQNLPTRRSLEAVLNLAPGVTNNVAMGGAQHSSNAFSLDRVSLDDPYIGGAFVPIHHNWLESVQVIGVGAPAEYGQFTGAIVNGVVRSGGNRFAALADYVGAVPRWTGRNTDALPEQHQRAFAPADLQARWDASIQLGGPVRKDRLWFFAAAHQVRERFRPFDYGGPESTSRWEPGGIVKLDAAAARNIAMQGFYQRDVADTTNVRLSRLSPTRETAGLAPRRNHVWNARATWTIDDRTVAEVRSGGYDGVSRLDPAPPATAQGPPARQDLLTGRLSGNVLNVVKDERSGIASSVRLTHRRRLAGWHDLTVGLEYQRSHADTFVTFGGGRIELYAADALQSMIAWEGNHTQLANRRTSAYVQDRWLITDRVTLEPGLRIEAYDGRVRARRSVFATRPVAPRLGVSWNVRGTGRTVARAHFGRYHDMPFAYPYSWHDVEGFAPRITSSLVGPGEFVEVDRVLDAIPPAPIDARLKHAHMDQLATAVEHQLSQHVVVEGRYVNRRFGRFIGYVDSRLDDWEVFTAPDPGPDGLLGTGDEGGPLHGYVPYAGERDLVIRNPDGAFRQYDALQVIGTSRNAGHWHAQASYTWSRTVGTVTGLRGSNATLWGLSPLGFGGAPGGATSLRDAGATPSQFDYSEWKLLGWYRADWLRGLSAGAVYRWHTGSRWHRLAVIRHPPHVAFVAAETPHSRRAPSVALLDFRVEKTLRLRPAAESLGVYAEALNATNVGRALAYVRTSGPSFGEPQSWTEPRIMRIGVRYSF